MEKQEFIEALTQIGTCEDDVQRRELITALQDEAVKDYDSLSAMTEQNATLTADVESLREANMKMFLRLGESKSGAEILQNSTGIEDKPKEKRKFEDLFDEKGGLK